MSTAKSARTLWSVLVDRVFLSLPGLFLIFLAVLSLTTACSTPTKDQKKQLNEAIDLIIDDSLETNDTFLMSVGVLLKDKLRNSHLFVNSFNRDAAGFTTGSVAEDSAEIHLNQGACFSSGVQDFPCTVEFFQLLITLVHEGAHCQQPPEDIFEATNDLQKKVRRMKFENDAYNKELTWKLRLLQIIRDIRNGKKVPKHFRIFVTCPDLLLKKIEKALSSYVADEIAFIDWCDERIEKFDGKPDPGDVEAKKINNEQMAKWLGDVHHNFFLNSAFSQIRVTPLTPDDQIQILESGIPHPLGMGVFNDGKVLIVCGITDEDNPTGMVREFVDTDGDGFYDQAETLVGPGSFLTTPRHVATSPDGEPFIYDSRQANLYQVIDKDSSGVYHAVSSTSVMSASADVLIANHINTFDWQDEKPVGFHMIAGVIDTDTKVAHFEKGSDGLLHLVELKRPLDYDQLSAKAYHPVFVGLKTLSVFGAKNHPVQVVKVTPKGKETVVASGTIGSSNEVNLTLTESIQGGGHRYKIIDTQLDSIKEATPVHPRPHVHLLDNRTSPLSGGVLVTATGFFLSNVNQVIVGDVPATIVSVNETQVQFITPAQQTGGNKLTVFRLSGAGDVPGSESALVETMTFGDDIFYQGQERIIRREAPSSIALLSSTGPTLVQIHAFTTSTVAPFAGKQVVAQDLEGNVLAVTSTDNSGDASLWIDAGNHRLCRVFVDVDPEDLKWQRRKPCLYVHFPKNDIIAGP